ncbi:hypothetical protein PAXINDRAFT_17655 [Paxillus involutus ATCC 200175]|uniref:Uncharacterized protein n=1 Tax=Paxillus involutus ATCC 200175 TaxID=664439 RepID=A0A0C9T0N9_PAXIN|nr:hypothetical protein PAXINDRAFT_17655 [Paxillus involutus ATCC 200175]
MRGGAKKRQSEQYNLLVSSKDDAAGASRPSTAPSATYDDMNDLVTTTARPGAASNVSTRAASVATVPDDEDDSATGPGLGPSQALIPGLSGQARPVHHYTFLSQTGGHFNGTEARISQLNPAPQAAEIIKELPPHDWVITRCEEDTETALQTENEAVPGTIISLEYIDGEDYRMDLNEASEEWDAGGSRVLESTGTLDVEVQTNTKKQREAFCTTCEEWINLSQSKQSLYAYLSHVGSQVCHKATNKKRMEVIRREEAQLCQQLFRPSRPSPRRHSPPESIQSSRSANYSNTAVSHSTSPTPSPSQECTLSTLQTDTCQSHHPSTDAHAPGPSPTPLRSTSESGSSWNMSTPLSTDIHPDELPLCKGVQLNWPVGTIFETYPWTQHEYGAKGLGYHF